MTRHGQSPRWHGCCLLRFCFRWAVNLHLIFVPLDTPSAVGKPQSETQVLAPGVR